YPGVEIKRGNARRVREKGGGIRKRERRYPPYGLAGHPQRLAAGDQQLQLGAASEKMVGQPCSGFDNMLAAVEDQQSSPATKVGCQRIDDCPAWLVAHVEHGGDGFPHERCIRDSAEF